MPKFSCHFVIMTALLFLNLGTLVRAQDGKTDSPPHERQARKVVEQLQEGLIEVMKMGEEGHPFEERLNRVAGLTEATQEQRKQFLAKFTELSNSSYANRFDSFEGETFFISESQVMGGKKERIVIKAVLQIPNRDNVDFVYFLVNREDGWKIVNILAEGVSDLALKRAEYTSILEKDGYKHLISQLENKIHENSHDAKS